VTGKFCAQAGAVSSAAIANPPIQPIPALVCAIVVVPVVLVPLQRPSLDNLLAILRSSP
jgi:hypothetical protein